jgi:hypothetical protein
MIVEFSLGDDYKGNVAIFFAFLGNIKEKDCFHKENDE